MTRIVVTGLGAITPIGNDVESFWAHLTAGVSGAGPLAGFDAADLPVRVACEVKGFDPTRFMSRKVARHTTRATQFAVDAARQALADADLTVDGHNRERVGVVLNTGGGGLGDMEPETRTLIQRGPRRVSPFFITRVMPNAAACQISLEVGARGPVLASALACASGEPCPAGGNPLPAAGRSRGDDRRGQRLADAAGPAGRFCPDGCSIPAKRRPGGRQPALRCRARWLCSGRRGRCDDPGNRGPRPAAGRAHLR